MTAPCWPTVAATGPRPEHLAVASHRWVRSQLDMLAVRLHEQGTTVGISGLARGVDTWWAQAVLDHGMALRVYIPGQWQPDRWGCEDRAVWGRLVAQAARIWEPDGGTPAQCLHARNGRMVRDCDLLLGVWDEAAPDGGTASTVDKARASRRPILHVDPAARAVTWPEIQTTTEYEQETLPI